MKSLTLTLLVGAALAAVVGVPCEHGEPGAAHAEAMALGLDFTSYCVAHLPNDFVTDLREKGTPVITWTVRDEMMRAQTYKYAEQMTFEGFDPRQSPAIA